MMKPAGVFQAGRRTGPRPTPRPVRHAACLLRLGVVLAGAWACRSGAEEMILCGYVAHSLFTATQNLFAAYSAVTDSNRVSRIRAIAEAGSFAWTPERGFIPSTSKLLDLFVCDIAGRRVTKHYCLTEDHMGLRSPPPPWGEPGQRKSPTVLNDNRSALRAVLLEVLAEFDRPRSWPQMPLPPQVDTSGATNREERNDLRDYLRGLATESPATNAEERVLRDYFRGLAAEPPSAPRAEDRVPGQAATTARTNLLAEMEQQIARIETAKDAAEQRAAADALVIYLSGIVAAGRGYFHRGETVDFGAKERKSLTDRLAKIADGEFDSYYLRTTLLYALGFLDNEASATAALAWLRTIGSDAAPVDADKKLALSALAGHVITVRGESGVGQLRSLTASKDWPAAAGEAREAIEQVIRLRTSSHRAPSPGSGRPGPSP